LIGGLRCGALSHFQELVREARNDTKFGFGTHGAYVGSPRAAVQAGLYGNRACRAESPMAPATTASSMRRYSTFAVAGRRGGAARKAQVGPGIGWP